MSSWIPPVYNFIMWALWMVTFHLQFKARRSVWLVAAIEAVVFVPYYWLVTDVLHDFTVLRLFLGEGIVLAMPLLLHRGKWHEIVLIWLSIFLIALATDMFVFYLGQSAVAPGDLDRLYAYPLWEYGATLLIEVILLTMLNLGAFSMRKRSGWQLRPLEIVLLFSYPVLQLTLFVYWLTVLWNDIARYNMKAVGLAFFVCLLSDFVLFFLIRSLANSSIMSAKVRMLEREYEQQDRLYGALAEDYAQVVSMHRTLLEQRRHFADLLDEGRGEEALRYADALETASAAQTAMPSCRHRVLASFLQHRKEDMESRGIRADFSVALPAEIGIEAPSLICLFGNLLDNAVEACADVPSPVTELKCDWRAPYLRVRMENSVAERKRAQARRVPELERGVGFTILQQLTETYDGEFRTDREGGRFITSVTWKGATTDAEDRGL
ncbi:MAG: sensor histidine kinase [Clostridia bacterium]|nr:sensor histidine kinase [Clostridia bacterium]